MPEDEEAKAGNEPTKEDFEETTKCITRGQELLAKHFGSQEKMIPALQGEVCKVATAMTAALIGAGHAEFGSRIHMSHQLLHDETSSLMMAAIYYAVGFAEDNEIR